MNLAKYIRAHKPLRGGLHLPDPRVDAGHRDFCPLPPVTDPELRILRVPLVPDRAPAAAACVAVGDTVSAGDVIGRDPEDRAIHAPVRGVVHALGHAPTVYAAEVPTVDIVPADDDDAPAFEMLAGQLTHPPTDRTACLHLLRAAGVNTDALAPFAGKATPAAVIINGLDATGWQHHHTQMLYRYGEVLIEAAALLHRLFDVRRTWLAVDRADAALTRLCERRSRRTPVRITALDNKYPQGLPRLLIKTILQREAPLHGTPADIGAVVFDASEMVDIARALRGGPVTHRFISIVGHAARAPGNYRVPLGISIAALAQAVGAERAAAVVADCLLSGPSVTQPAAVITRRTQLVYFAAQASPPPQPIPCIRCGFCQDICPVWLDPLALWQAAWRRRYELALPLHPDACLDCGLCDYVCPSELPLMRGAQECRRHVAEH